MRMVLRFRPRHRARPASDDRGGGTMNDEPELVAEVTPAMIEVKMFKSVAHYNMGKAGYGYGYRCIKYPRLSFVDYFFRPSRKNPDGADVRIWYADGKERPNLGD